MGLGYEALRKIKPDLIMISLSGYGDTGPYHDYVAYGPAQVPLSGLSSLTGYKGWPPMHAGFSYADPNAGVHGAFAVLAALYHRAENRRRPVHRHEPVGVRDGAAARGHHGLHDERARARA